MEASPDRGAATYTYDSAGNVKTRKDARNTTLTYCSMASSYQIASAGIDNEHEFKKEYVKGSLSRYDICACDDGSIKIAGRGQCGTAGPKIEAWARWK